MKHLLIPALFMAVLATACKKDSGNDNSDEPTISGFWLGKRVGGGNEGNYALLLRPDSTARIYDMTNSGDDTATAKKYNSTWQMPGSLTVRVEYDIEGGFAKFNGSLNKAGNKLSGKVEIGNVLFIAHQVTLGKQ